MAQALAENSMSALSTICGLQEHAMNRLIKAVGGLLLFLFSLGISFFFYGSQVSQGYLGAIDDHEIVYFMGNKGGLELQQLPSNLMKTEVGSAFSGTVRFRPVYYGLRLIEVWLWKDSPELWYATRVVLFAITNLFFACCVWLLIGFPASLVSLVSLGGLFFWSDIWGRLGPAEAYGAIFVSFWSWSIIQLFRARSHPSQNVYLFLISTTSVLLAGIKEPFLFIPAISSVIFIAFGVHRRRGSAVLLALFPMVASSVFIFGVIYYGLSKAGADVYGQSTAFSQRMALLFVAIERSSVMIWVPLGVLAFVSAVFKRRVLSKKTFAFCFVAICLLAVYAGNYVVYGNIPTNSRYDFPAELCFPALIVASIGFIFSMIERKRTLLVDLVAASIFTLSFYIGVKNDFLNYAPELVSHAVERNIESTRRFSTGLREVIDFAKQHPNEPIIVRARGSWESYEAFFSVLRYLQFNAIKNPVGLEFERTARDLHGTFPGELARQLESYTSSGGKSDGKDFVLPRDVLHPSSSSCIVISINTPLESYCFSRNIY
jgi:hypothetical protein